jgi:hypothetical protein
MSWRPEGWKNPHGVALQCDLAIHLLEKLVPYLRVKLPQAKVAIEFGLIRMGATQTRRRTDGELAQLNLLKDQLLVLNKRGN